MTKLDTDMLILAEATIPRLRADGPLFPLAWHSRIFALIVALVENGQVPWKEFQFRLVNYLRGHEDASRHGDDITNNYFERWLEAVEDTLIDSNFVKQNEIPEQIERIRASVAEIRSQQTGEKRPS